MGKKPAVDRLCLGIPCGEVRAMSILCVCYYCAVMHLTLTLNHYMMMISVL